MKKVYIMPNRKKTNAVRALDDIVSFITSKGYEVEIAEINDSLRKRSYDDAICFLVLGGDGTIIDVANYTAEFNIPIVGMNFGNIGYLAQLGCDDLDKLLLVFDDKAPIQKRMMLDVCVEREGEVLLHTIAVNDAVLSNGPLVNLISYDIYANGALSETIRSDGLIIATPTGSSAYSMSAGGPLLDPEIDGICITPNCPQKLNVRPCVYRGNTIIELKNISCRNNSVYLLIDGKESIEILPNDIIKIMKSKNTMDLVCLDNRSFLEILYSKLTDKID